ncbi:hypothetical protein MVEN_01044100 [Mycena venus]|uniref:Uncharacterized protein n=1 Tax=Mycena venus TaxID=2733690 RepID=A0A8H6Y3Q9_9AGAR|nr:hypothetical protein MVEN_01044100 [Mycena venus]
MTGDSEPAQVKCPVGRPPKLVPAKKLNIRVGNITARGTPAVIHSQQLPSASGAGYSDSLHPIFNPQLPSTTCLSPTVTPSHEPPAANTTVDNSLLIVEEGQDDDVGDEGDKYSGLLDDGLGDEEEESDDEEPTGDVQNSPSLRQ